MIPIILPHSCPPIMASALPKAASALPVSIGNRVGEVGGAPLCPVRMALTLACLSGPTQLQKNKEQEEQLGEMIQAYEKLCVEKSDLETELGEMVRPREWAGGTRPCVILYEQPNLMIARVVSHTLLVCIPPAPVCLCLGTSALPRERHSVIQVMGGSVLLAV